ncbi:MAG: MFS transporter [Spirochaetia bacterium]|jgi:DHA1 family multidrug resistance protein-like MFS transporter
MPNWEKSFYAIFAGEILALIGFTASIPIIPFFIRDLGVDDPASLNIWVGACATAPAISMFLFAPLWGQLADSHGKRLMLLRAMIGGAAVIALTGAVNRPWQLLVLRGFQGALTGTVSAATVLVASISPKERLGYTLGMLQTGIYVGASVGPAFGGLLSDLFGHRVAFLVPAVFLVAAAVIVMRFVKNDAVGTAPPGSFVRSVIPDFSPLAHSPGLIVLLLVSGGLQIATSTVAPILPLFIQSISPQATKVGSMTGLILGGSAVAAALSSAGLGRVSYRIGYERLLAFCLAGAVLVFLPQAFVRNPIQLLVLRVLGGAFIGGSEPSINAMIAMRADRRRQGMIFGLNTSMNSAGAAVGPMLGAVSSAGFGYASAFFAGTAVLLASAIGARTVRKIEPQHEEL